MAMQWLENELRRSNDARKKAWADVVSAMRESIGDVPLPIDVQETPASDEAPHIERFAPETEAALAAQGFVIMQLGGISIAQLQARGEPLLVLDQVPRDRVSPRREVAFSPHPTRLFLPGSENLPLGEQRRLLQNYGARLSSSTPGIKVMIGEPQDYAQLALDYLKDSDTQLFGKEYQFGYARTRTVVEGLKPMVVEVGAFKRQLRIKRGLRDASYPIVRIVPLVVPKTLDNMPQNPLITTPR